MAGNIPSRIPLALRLESCRKSSSKTRSSTRRSTSRRAISASPTRASPTRSSKAAESARISSRSPSRRRRAASSFISTPSGRRTGSKKTSSSTDIRRRVRLWREGGYVGVTPTTARLLAYWTDPDREKKLFFCQIEALETAIYITEVAKKYGDAWIENELREANDTSNPGLPRIAFKMATGSGKTVVMAMLIAWQTLNKLANPQDARFSDTFLIVTPGITIRDRLRVLLPNDPQNYYRQRDIVPARIAGAAWAGQDPHHQLPRLPAAREGRRRQAHQGDSGRRPAERVHRDARPDGPPRLPRAGQQEEHHRHQRRGPSLLPPQAGRRGREAHRRRPQGSRSSARKKPASGFPASRPSKPRSASRPSTTSRPRRSSCAARATPKARSSPGSSPTSR